MRSHPIVRLALSGAMALLLGALGGACGAKGGDTSTGGPQSKSDAGGDGATHPDGKAPADAGPADAPVDTGVAPPPWDGSLGPTPPVLPAPSHGILLGGFVGAEPETQTDSQSEQMFVTEEGLTDRAWVIDNRFYDDKTEWVNPRTSWDIAQHMVPLITWMPYAALDDYISGKQDAVVIAEAQKAKALGVQVLMRWGHEMNGNWYPWSGTNNGGAAAGATGGPAKYVAAYQHVHDLFVSQGATNVVWIWCINVADVPAETWNHWTNYYPGDAYVDWVGLDAYNWGSSSSCCVWQSFTDLVVAPYQDYVGKKPMMLPETASAEVGGDKAAWINDMHQALKTDFTAIHGVVWFDINKETDWRIASSPSALAAYKAMALDPYFNP
jgi:hypothetical protein